MGKHYPSWNARQLDKRLRELGCELIRQTGSHKHFSNPFKPEQLITYSEHTGDIPRGIIEDIIKDLGLTKMQFYDLRFML